MAQRHGCSDFPIACNSCIGPVPYLQLKKEDHCMECNLCSQPCIVFGWKPDKDAKFKKTVICKLCANTRSVCQLCLKRLDHDLPVQARATAFNINSTVYIPHRDDYGQYFADEHDHVSSDVTVYKSTYGKTEPNYTLMRHQRRMLFYQRNIAPVSSLYQRSQSTRGAACLYRHEIPITADNLEDKYYGLNVPLAPENFLGGAGSLFPKPMQAPDIQQIPSHLYYPSIPQTIQLGKVPYLSMDSQRMGSLIKSQPFKFNKETYWPMQPH